MKEKGSEKEEKVTFNIDKEKNFSEWFTEIIKRAELADLRYNVKGFIVFQPWSVISMELMYAELERILRMKGHKPYWYPAVIPESNFKLEKEHVEGFAPQVFWVTETGAGEKLEERLALRPTSETAFYQMFALWIRSYKDLPFKSYQRAQVFRYETKATRPFLRSREIYWIESHNAFASREDSIKQVKEDMQSTKELLYDFLCVPFIFFERPQWDKFAGAESTYAADSLMPDGRVVQLPSTHLLGQNFSKPFNITFKDEKGSDQYVWNTCYGPAVSRIFAVMMAIHGDNNGLVFPFTVSPVQVIIIPIFDEKNKEKVLAEAEKGRKELSELDLRAEIDAGEERLGDKLYFWEMKGIPLRIELGEKELKGKKALLFRRDTKKKELVALNELKKKILAEGRNLNESLRKKAEKFLQESIVEAKSIEEAKKLVQKGKIARVEFCSIGLDAVKCAEAIEKEAQASVRGKRIDLEEKTKGNCIVCGKKASVIVYIARSY
ncbi:MAG: proline--tRNA ligase [Candidatus Diapherotrites archaeon]